MLLEAAMTVGGLLGLWFSAEKTVGNAEKLIKSLGIPGSLFGAVFMSVSTGLPEMATAVISAFEGVPKLSAGDTTGSSLVNLTMVLGLTILAGKGLELHGEDLELIRDAGVFTIGAAASLILFGKLTFLAVAVLFVFYAGFLYKAEHSSFEMGEDGDTSIKTVFYTLLGVAALLTSAHILVNGAKGLGEAFGIPVEVLGATVVAVGTGLPELAFEISAVRNGDVNLALGDIFGSVLVNITLTIGVLGLLSTPSIATLVPVLFGVIGVAALAIAFSYGGDFSVKEASVLLLFFLGYLAYQVM